MSESSSTAPKALPGLWREVGGLGRLVRLDAPAITTGMVIVAKADEPWELRPELRWQVWSDLIKPDDCTDGFAGAENRRGSPV